MLASDNPSLFFVFVQNASVAHPRQKANASTHGIMCFFVNSQYQWLTHLNPITH